MNGVGFRCPYRDPIIFRSFACEFGVLYVLERLVIRFTVAVNESFLDQGLSNAACLF